MRSLLALAALGALVVGSLAACSDDDPLRLSDGDDASFTLRPQLSDFGASQRLPINLIRLTVKSLPDSAEVMDPVEETVGPNDPSWNLHLDVPLIGGQPIDVFVEVELINETGGVRTVEWSGIAGPFSLVAGETAEPPAVDMFRGSLDNLSITSVTIQFDGEASFLEGDGFVLRASAEGATGTPQFFWSSLDEAIALVDTAAGDSAIIQSLLPGVARIVVEAGPRADTLEVTFGTRIADVEIAPLLDTLQTGEQAEFVATALDPRGVEVVGTFFEWSSADVEIASVDVEGVVTAGIPGETWIRASAAGFTDSARVVVEPAGGRIALWTGAASTDWNDPANWSTGAVPGALDSVGIPAAAVRFPQLDTDAEIAVLEVENGATLSMGEVILTVHGHAVAQGEIVGSSATVIKDGPGAVEGNFPSLTLTAPTFLQGALVTEDNLYVNGIPFTPSGYGVTVGNTLLVYVGGSIVIGASDSVTVLGRTFFDDAETAGLLTGGSFVAHDDFVVTGNCGSFVPLGTEVIIADSATLSMECALATGNRFDVLRTVPGVDVQLDVQTAIVANRFTAIADDADLELIGPATSITARVVEIHNASIRTVQIRQETNSELDGLNFLNNTFSDFSGIALAQLVVARPGDEPIFASAQFDAGSEGPYVQAFDTDGVAPFVEMHVMSSSVNGPLRTVESGGAIVWWSGQAHHVDVVVGDGQSGIL